VIREPITTTTSDGWTLRGEVSIPVGAPRAVAVLGHAMMVDRKTMLRGPDRPSLGRTLGEHGIETLAFDLRGHGESAPSARDGARWSYDDIVRQDVPALVAAARARAGSHTAALPVVLVGHSLTAHAGLIAAGRDPELAPDAVVALAANLWAPRFDPHPLRLARKAALLATWGAITAARGHFDPRRFRLGSEAEPWPYVHQFLRFFFANRLASADGREDYGAALARVRIPVLAISSTGDRLLAHPRAVERFLAQMRNAPVTHRVVRGERAPDHMGLCVSPSQRPLWEEIAGWVVATLRCSRGESDRCSG
jgi:predicted alpha/beta hydrolase